MEPDPDNTGAGSVLIGFFQMEVVMQAKPGDRLVIKGHRTGQFDADAEILEVRGEGGQPPYLVRWSADGHEALVFPGSDAVIEHRRRKAPANKPA